MSTHPVAPPPAILPESPLVPNARLRQIYTLMLRCRAVHARVASLVAEGRVAAALLPPSGGEAMLASTAVELRSGDTLCCTRQDWLPAIIKGVPLAKVARWLLASTGSRQRLLSDPAHRLQLLPSQPGSQLAAVVEAAAAHKRRKGSLALACIGSEPPVEAWEQALQLAGRRRLPLLFLCRSGSAQPDAPDFSALAQTTQTPHIYVDGSDALAVYRVAQEATGRARRGLGATLIECHIDTRTLEPDPFAAMERHLAAKGVWSLAWKQETEAAIAQELEAALHSAAQRRVAPAAPALRG